MTDPLPEGLDPAELAALRTLAKEELRKRLAAVRRAVPQPTREAYAEAVGRTVVAHEAFARAALVLAYSPLRFEMSPLPIIEQAWAAGKQVALPRILPDTRELALHLYRPGDELVESGFVVKEPVESAPAVAPEQVDLVLVPGLAFDARGHRLGYGQGYYDRLLPRLPRAVRIALAFELSLLVEVPAAAHDVPVDFVITERRLLQCTH